jgi:hypothetical protein
VSEPEVSAFAQGSSRQQAIYAKADPEQPSEEAQIGRVPPFAESEIAEKRDFAKRWGRQLVMYLDEEGYQEKAEVELCNKNGETKYSCLLSEEMEGIILRAAVAQVGRNSAAQDYEGAIEANRSVLAGQKSTQVALGEYQTQSREHLHYNLSAICLAGSLRDEPEVKTMYAMLLRRANDHRMNLWDYTLRHEHRPLEISGLDNLLSPGPMIQTTSSESLPQSDSFLEQENPCQSQSVPPAALRADTPTSPYATRISFAN